MILIYYNELCSNNTNNVTIKYNIKKLLNKVVVDLSGHECVNQIIKYRYVK
jgi:hypothetical protein